MERRGFLKFLGTGIATAALAVHMKFGELAPVLEPVKETTLSFANTFSITVSSSGMFSMGDALKVDGEVVRITAIRDGVIEIERPRRWTLHGIE